ncbi:poly-gamma-glutamate system protein [Francisella frigiditurris]|uniref:Poly-gamma-glutamate system family protein n=1 Tax=Francisella frigiditurris TaxID=1542390 RepID=A0A1J0KR32_9GAMM|nr:poly-gamma-glutamate system protein [Francisella frigiditurris]APC96208.1 poly-gamma-glutamate system family protein [Francisella frigiditurris]
MKNMYWHRKFLSRYIIVFLCAFMIVSLYIVEGNLVVENKGMTQKLEAANIAFNAFKTTQREFLSKGYYCSKVGDVSCTGLIGESMTEITTDSGDLYAKRSSVNPNIAALFVSWLTQLDLKEGDVVAVQETGSYPALDIAMLSAIKALKLKPIIIFSVGSSQFGANRPDFTWPDIYKNLVKNGVFDYDILGITLGGSRDTGYGMSPAAILKLNDAVKRNGYKLINVPYKDSTNRSIKTRMELYKKAIGDDKIKAYINVGGNMASIGLKQIDTNKNTIESNDKKDDEKETKKFVRISSFPPGITKKLPIEYKNVNSVAVNYLKEGIAVVNIRDINSSIVEKYGITYNPTTMTPPGQGAIFAQKKYNTTLAAILLIIDIILITVVAILSRRYLISYKTK